MYKEIVENLKFICAIFMVIFGGVLAHFAVYYPLGINEITAGTSGMMFGSGITLIGLGFAIMIWDIQAINNRKYIETIIKNQQKIIDTLKHLEK